MRVGGRFLAVIGSIIAPIVAGAQDWPRFHGPAQDNRSPDTGLLQAWPEGGPPLLWRAQGLGEGYSTVAIAGERIYTTGDMGADLVITALDPAGQTVWTQKAGAAFTRAFPGSRATPTIHEGRLYAIGGNGELGCFDATTGEPVWSVNFMQQFGGREVPWGVAESPLIVGDTVICCPGGPNVLMAALDRHTGETRWTCQGLDEDHAYASAALVDYGGLRQIVTMTNKSAVGVEAETGRLLWRHAHEASYGVNCGTPVFDDGHLYLFTTWGRGATKLRLVVNGADCAVEQVWNTPEFDNEHGGTMLVDGYWYGHADGAHKRRHFACLEDATARIAWTSDELSGQASAALTYADGLLYVVTDQGDVALVRPNPERLEIISRFRVPEGGAGPVWAYPVVCGGRLYLRHGEFLYAYDLRPQG